MKYILISSPRECPYVSCNGTCNHWFFTLRKSEYEIHQCNRRMSDIPEYCPLQEVKE